MEYVGSTSKWLWSVRILVLRFVIPEACMYSLSLSYEVGAWFIIDCLPYEWRSGTSDGLFLPIYPPRSMHVVLWFLMTYKFLQQVYEFFWLMLSPWIIRTLTFPPLLAFLIPRTFRRYHTHTIYLPQNSHHTYLLWHFHRHSEICCHATFHRSVFMSRIIIVILLCMIL